MDLLLQRATRTRVAVLPPHFQKSDLGLDEAYYSMMCPFDSGVREQYSVVYVRQMAACLHFRTLLLSQRYSDLVTTRSCIPTIGPEGHHGLGTQTEYQRM